MIIESDDDFEIYIDGQLFSWTEKENVAHIERLASILGLSIEYENIQPDD